jgi:hypothetical protein
MCLRIVVLPVTTTDDIALPSTPIKDHKTNVVLRRKSESKAKKKKKKNLNMQPHIFTVTERSTKILKHLIPYISE